MTVVGSRRPWPCVRCGRRPRSRDTYLCDPCLASPKANEEARQILRSASRYIEQRRIAIEDFGWVGGWGRDRYPTEAGK